MSAIIEQNVQVTIVACNDCKNKKTVTSCKAFEIIPDEILSGDNMHTEKLEGQENDIVFEIVDNPRWIK